MINSQKLCEGLWIASWLLRQSARYHCVQTMWSVNLSWTNKRKAWVNLLPVACHVRGIIPATVFVAAFCYHGHASSGLNNIYSWTHLNWICPVWYGLILSAVSDDGNASRYFLFWPNTNLNFVFFFNLILQIHMLSCFSSPKTDSTWTCATLTFVHISHGLARISLQIKSLGLMRLIMCRNHYSEHKIYIFPTRSV